MSDSIIGGRKFRTFYVRDDCSRETLAIEIGTSMSSKRVIRVLDRVNEEQGKPASVIVDDGRKFSFKDFELCAKKRK